METPGRELRGPGPNADAETSAQEQSSNNVNESEILLTNSESLENIHRMVDPGSNRSLDLEGDSPRNTATEVLHNNTEQFPSEDQSSVLFPLPTNSEDIRNENHLVLTRVIDTSIWELPVEISNSTAADFHSRSSIEPPTCSTWTEIQGRAETQGAEPELERSSILTHKETETDIIENPMSEPHCVHVIAEWPATNADFEVLSKLDDEYMSQDPFMASHQVSDIFDPKDWFLQLSDEDIPPERRLRHNPGQFCLTRGDSWAYFENTEDTEDDYDEPDH
ncbi:unnamed protein product [Allacma fusca]|uniref:Uncharacterized protein n=1 Tax=Allacma fusca TaxID=39272 RepID=A0A8J2PK02_9HEXA|nr:unnamed protein product [Allacma fusca]